MSPISFHFLDLRYSTRHAAYDSHDYKSVHIHEVLPIAVHYYWFTH